jgi:hypothetical protein
MSTDSTNPTDPTPAAPTTTEPTTAEPTTAEPTTAGPAASEQTATESTSEGTLANVEETESAPGFIARHTTTLITAMVAVIVAAAAIAGVSIYKHNVDEANTDTAAAFAKSLAQQGATPETIECDGDECAAIIQGQAYTVLVQEDAKGKQHFGIVSYTGE